MRENKGVVVSGNIYEEAGSELKIRFPQGSVGSTPIFGTIGEL